VKILNIDDIVKKVRGHTPIILGSEKYIKSAVLIPLLIKNGDIHILFEVRSLNLKRQPGEICFPGGRVDASDNSEQDAAIRETIEELGIRKDQISHIYPLDYLISPFGMAVYPFFGIIHDTHTINPNEAEVGEVFTVPLSFFLENEPEIFHVHVQMQPEENFPFERIVGGRNYKWRAGKIDEYFYQYDGKVIWGLTARILTRFIEIIRKESR
jgi:peroxisomal coenzyme A diphosphatase NUDT7